MLTEREIIQRARENSDAFGQIIDLYEGKLKRYLFRLGVMETEDQEDLLQEVFWKSYKNLNDFDDGLSFSSWIYRITRNTAYDFFRKKKSQGKLQIFSEDVYDLFWNQLKDETQDIEKKFDKKQRRKAIAIVLQKVPEKYREVLILLFLEEKSYKEISDILQKKENTVATLLARGKQKFKKLFLQKFNISDF
ncbi:RNA polymerase sigma factor [Candidatus Gracilibacteria bacterium]|nr:RNA polymerase sigma factor [Candidatus Gracilibacteria bacterium]